VDIEVRPGVVHGKHDLVLTRPWHNPWVISWCRRAMCCQGWLGQDHPDYWVPYRPGLL
jgi:hypothetical protein